MLSRLADPLLALIYPQNCRICDGSVERSADGPACGDCWNDTHIFSAGDPRCGKCGAYPFGTRPGREGCPHCDGHHYDSAAAAGVYGSALAACVIRLKSEPYIPPRLKRHLASLLDLPLVRSCDVVIPVPLSKLRYLERGFNQAEVIAKFVSSRSGILLDSKSLVRTVHTPMHRAAMDQKAREKSVSGAFDVVRPKFIDGRSVLLVDDVFTTGATVSNCAKILKKNGARRVNVLTIARAASG